MHPSLLKQKEEREKEFRDFYYDETQWRDFVNLKSFLAESNHLTIKAVLDVIRGELRKEEKMIDDKDWEGTSENIKADVKSIAIIGERHCLLTFLDTLEE